MQVAGQVALQSGSDGVSTFGRAGRPHSIFAVIDYTGRRTARRYTTPIRVVEQPDGFIVPLTYGPKTGWYVNLQAGAGYLHWQGARSRWATHPGVHTHSGPTVAAAVAIPVLARRHRRVRKDAEAQRIRR
ncbi:MAG TPA: hypothetical protein VLZ05_19340 [Mycobacterium sp.]|nr:hypothetical protein [Mycobacterium sp.]HUH70835.1 hypothetical protein [Mycobacterium sp.]